MPNFSGKWNLQGQLQGIKQGDWTGILFESFELYAWGNGGSGRLGNNIAQTIDVSSPVQIGALTTWADISGGDEFSLGLTTDGKLYGWGNGDTGRLGNNNTIHRSSPVQIGSETNWQKISAGDRSSMAIKTDGTLWAWGDAGEGRLGINTNQSFDISSPVQVGALTNWADISAGANHCIALKTDGTLWAWGSGSQGRTGLGDTVYRSSPVQIGSGTNWSKISAGGAHSHAITTSGELYAWGYNNGGRLGLGDVISRSSPVQIGALTTWNAVSASRVIDGFAVKTDGTLWSWGGNTLGELGQNDTVSRSSPVQIGALTNWSEISAGNFHCLAIKTDKTLWAWGDNGNDGELGDGTIVDKSSPIQIGSLSWSKVATGANHSLAIVDNSYRTGMPS